MEILPGIHQIPGLNLSNFYLLVDEDQLTLIDAGLPWDGGRILRYIRLIGRRPDELRQVLLTHGHPDHTGPLPLLHRQTGATVAVHPADTMDRGTSRLRSVYYPGQPPMFDWNVPFMHPIPFHETLEDGQSLPVMGGVQVLHTPGHTAGSVCFYLPARGVLFTGDMLIANGSAFRRPVWFPGTNLRDYRRSIERLSRLDFTTACVGHGKHIASNGQARLQDMLEDYAWLAPRWKSFKEWARSLIRR